MPNINLNYKMVTDIKNNFFTNNRFIAAESLPAEGDFVKGDLIVNIGENANDEAMWLCVESGNPGVWEVVGAGTGGNDGNTSGGGSSKIVTLKSRVTVNNALSEVNIGVSGFNKATDTLIVFNNARFMAEGVDYEINANSTKIVATNGNIWNEELANNFVFDFVVFKMMNVNENGEVVVSSANEILKLKNTVVVNESVNEVEIGIDGFNEGDDLTVYRNSVYMIEGIDYEVQGNKIVSLKGAWNAEGGSDYKFTFEVLKTVAKVNPDAVVGMEHLTEDVKEAIEAAGNIDLSGYATKEEMNGKVAQEAYNNKIAELEGRVEEAFTSANNGKQLIASAIGNPLITGNSTFSAMSEAILGYENNLRIILTDEGVSVSDEDNMDSLIAKVDEEFDRQNTELENNKGLDIISATELPSEVVNNRIVLITANTPTDINVKDSSLCNPTTNGEMNIGIVTVPDDSGVPYNITQNNIMMSLYLKVAKERVNNVVSTLNGYAGIGGQWVQFSKASFLVYDNGQDNYGISTSSNWSLAYASFTPGTRNFAIYINGHGDNAWQDASAWFNKKFDLTNYSTLKITGTKHSSATFGFSTSIGSTASMSKSFSLGTSSSEITVDISSLTGEYYLLVKGRSATTKYAAASISRFELIP